MLYPLSYRGGRDNATRRTLTGDRAAEGGGRCHDRCMRIRLKSTVLDTNDPQGLADFYVRLLGWTYVANEPDWVTIAPPGGGTQLAFQPEPLYARPTWPAQSGTQQMQSHSDFAVDDLDAAKAHALACGATVAPWQPQDDVVVCFDPHGHVFCLFESA